MSRRNKNKKDNHPPPGRGRGRGSEGLNGAPTTIALAIAPAGRAPRHSYPHRSAEVDEVIQRWPDSPSTLDDNGKWNVNRGHGPWGGGTPKSRSGTRSPLRGMGRGDLASRGMGAGRGRGRGRGRGGERDNGENNFRARRRPYLGSVGVDAKARTVIRKDAPLSNLLYAERPLLRPVKFVPSTLTPFLFQHSEDVLKPASSQATETPYAPTADRVARLFRANAPDSHSKLDDHPQDVLEEIDFEDLAQVRAEVDAIAQDTAMIGQDIYDDQEEIEEVDFADLVAMRVSAAEPQVTSQHDVIRGTFAGVYNQIENTAQVPDTAGVADSDHLHSGQQTTSLLVPPALNNPLDPKSAIEIPSQSDLISFPNSRDTIVIEEEVPRSPTASPNVSTQKLSLPTTSESYPASGHAGDIPCHHDSPPYKEHSPLFVVDTTPTRSFTRRPASDIILVDRADHGEVLGDQDEELIVYVAPHPRSGRVSPVPAVPRVKLPQTSMLTGKSLEAAGGLRSPVIEDDVSPMPSSDRDRIMYADSKGEAREDYLSLASLTLEPTTSAFTSTSSHVQRPQANVSQGGRRRVRPQRQNKRGRTAFGTYGLVMSEARLREEVKEGRHPRWETRRKGDSDIDWGTENEDGEGEAEDSVSDGLGGMDIDSDLDMDMDTMQVFLMSMSAGGSQFMTIDDIEDEAQMRQEEESEGGNSDSDQSDDEEGGGEEEEEEKEERGFDIEEKILIAKSKADEALELSEDSDDELSPGSSFQVRLRKLRERRRAQHPEATQNILEDIKDLEENSYVPAGHNRKEEEMISHNLYQGHVNEWTLEAQLDDPEFMTPVNKKNGKKGKCKQATGYFAAELEAQWAKDRAKKAENKRQRRATRILADLDRLDSSVAFSVGPGVIVDIVSLEAQVRRFVKDLRWKSMVLPPMDNETRKTVHEMARVFGMKSVSKGSGDERYTTLFKTDQKGVKVKEEKVKTLVKRYGRGKSGRGNGNGDGKGEGRKVIGGRMPRNREGDEVGKEAPKIGENNIGFRILASMGWSDGDRIGGTASVGISAPLVAIFKKSKLGLGATR